MILYISWEIREDWKLEIISMNDMYKHVTQRDKPYTEIYKLRKGGKPGLIQWVGIIWRLNGVKGSQEITIKEGKNICGKYHISKNKENPRIKNK